MATEEEISSELAAQAATNQWRREHGFPEVLLTATQAATNISCRRRHGIRADQLRTMTAPWVSRSEVEEYRSATVASPAKVANPISWERSHTARHEAGHAVVAYALGHWPFRIVAEERHGLTQSVLFEKRTNAEVDRDYAIILAGGCAATRSVVGYGADEDRATVRILGMMSFEDAQAEAERILAEPRNQERLDHLEALLLERGKLEAGEVLDALENAPTHSSNVWDRYRN